MRCDRRQATEWIRAHARGFVDAVATAFTPTLEIDEEGIRRDVVGRLEQDEAVLEARELERHGRPHSRGRRRAVVQIAGRRPGLGSARNG